MWDAAGFPHPDRGRLNSNISWQSNYLQVCGGSSGRVNDGAIKDYGGWLGEYKMYALDNLKLLESCSEMHSFK